MASYEGKGLNHRVAPRSYFSLVLVRTALIGDYKANVYHIE
jgi:hypothetical protein